MRTNVKHEVIARIAGPGLVLTALLVMVLSSSSVGRAQSSAPLPTLPAAPANAAPAAQAGTPAAQSEPQRGGNHEGIKVHGHWTIEVKNPDGKLVSHTEFENSLVSSGTTTLSSLLLGESSTGGYEVILTGASVESGPCPAIASGATACYLVGSLVSPLPAAFGDINTECGGTGFTNQITATGPCFPLTASAVSGGIAVSGTAVASTTMSIAGVSFEPLTCGAGGAPAQGQNTASPNLCAQGSVLSEPLTHATLATPVTISAAGQLISVNVQLTFQ
jgi:hypothetical protein